MSHYNNFSELLCKAAAEADSATGRTKLRDIIARLIEKAVSGDIRAIMLIADRLDGAPTERAIKKRDASVRRQDDADLNEARQKE